MSNIVLYKVMTRNLFLKNKWGKEERHSLKPRKVFELKNESSVFTHCI